MKNIDMILHFLNDAEFNEAFISDFERQMLRTKYDISIEEKRGALENIKEELDSIIRNLAKDHSNCSEFLGWLTDYIIPEVIPNLYKDIKLKNRNFTLKITTADIEEGMDFEEDIKTRIATIFYQEFQTKNIFYLQVCQYCNKIYIPKRLNKAAKYCSEDCKNIGWKKEQENLYK